MKKHPFILLILILIFAAAAPRPARTAAAVLETFEGSPSSWVVTQDVSGGSITRSSAYAAAGAYSARLSTSGTNQKAALYITFSDPASAHTWNERTATWHWQRAAVYLPSATVNQLAQNEYFTLAGMWASSSPSTYGWYLRVTQGGALVALGTPASGSPESFQLFGSFPLDQWVELEIGLNTQNGPGIKRAFAVVVDGEFYGWYRQGRLENETYDRAAIGILSGNTAKALVAHVDQWRSLTTAKFPDGPDNRPTTNLQEQVFTSGSGALVQYDWSTWVNTPTLDPAYGLYPAESRVQAGRTLDRMPSVANGWGEIEIDWPNGTPPTCTGYCSAMIGFHKEINREENLEVIPIADGSGVFNLALEAWVGSAPQILAQWRIPNAQAAPGRNMPEPGDVIRARWEQSGGTQIRVRASYYDASAALWFKDVIDRTFTATNIGGVNFLDGYHEASSITIDSPFYAIRRYKVGVLSTYPEPVATPTLTAPANAAILTDTRPTFRWSSVNGAARYEVQLDSVNPPALTVQDAAATSYQPPAPLLYRTYYWRVRALDDSGLASAWSEVWPVTIGADANAAPMVTVYNTATPTLTWNPVSWATGYEIQVDNHTNFSAPLFQDDSLGAGTLAVVVSAALADGMYYWRVRARRADGKWGAWSASGSFVVDTM
ncbi:MAG: hypothetical protein HXY41_13015 [Chloroflexi bacterium]|nr:hypothetical protein [Chloroflexota bacterium]